MYSYFYSTRNSSKDNLHLPRFSTARTQKPFKYVCAKLWNDILYAIKQLSFYKFKISSKNLLLETHSQTYVGIVIPFLL